MNANIIEIIIAGAIGLTLSFFAYQEFNDIEEKTLSCPECAIEKQIENEKTKEIRIEEITKQINEVNK